MANKKSSHAGPHQYYKAYPGSIGVGQFKGRAIWSCGLPGCDHFRPGNMAEPLDKASLCNNCMEVFVLEHEHMKMDKPLCNTCANPDRPAVPSNIANLLAARNAIKKYGVNKSSELTLLQRNMLRTLGIDVSILEPYEKEDEPDQIEIIEPTEE